MPFKLEGTFKFMLNNIFVLCNCLRMSFIQCSKLTHLFWLLQTYVANVSPFDIYTFHCYFFKKIVCHYVSMSSSVYLILHFSFTGFWITFRLFLLLLTCLPFFFLLQFFKWRWRWLCTVAPLRPRLFQHQNIVPDGLWLKLGGS